LEIRKVAARFGGGGESVERVRRPRVVMRDVVPAQGRKEGDFAF
jgi:hypothetical protein